MWGGLASEVQGFAGQLGVSPLRHSVQLRSRCSWQGLLGFGYKKGYCKGYYEGYYKGYYKGLLGFASLPSKKNAN